MPKSSVVLIRIALGILLIALPVYSGWNKLSLFFLPLLAVVFCAAYVRDKARLWSSLFEKPLDFKWLKPLAFTYFTQLIVVAVLFFLGRGFGSFFNIEESLSLDDPALVVLLVVNFLTVLFSHRIPRVQFRDLEDIQNRTEKLLQDLERNNQDYIPNIRDLKPHIPLVPNVFEEEGLFINGEKIQTTELSKFGFYNSGLNVTLDSEELSEEVKKIVFLNENCSNIHMCLSGLAFPTPKLEMEFKLPWDSKSFGENRPFLSFSNFRYGTHYEGNVVLRDGWFYMGAAFFNQYEKDQESFSFEYAVNLGGLQADTSVYQYSDFEEALRFDPTYVRKISIRKPTFKVPKETSALTQLEQLYVNTSMEEIPEGIGELKSLKDLTLIGKNIEKIPDSIYALENLERLFISGKMYELSPKIKNLKKLKFLFFTQSNIQSLPEELLECEELELIEVSRNQLKTLPEDLGNLPNLKKLSINGNSFTDLPKSLENIKYVDAKQKIKALYTDISYSSKNSNPSNKELYDLSLESGLVNQLNSKIKVRSNLEQYKKALLFEAKTAIRFDKIDEKVSTLGCTKVGGAPDLPKEFEHPISDKGEYWTFMAQINLEEISELQSYLPQKGLLSFFCEDAIHGVETEYPLIEKIKVFHFTEECLSWKYPHGADFIEDHFDEGPYEELLLCPKKIISLPYLYNESERLSEESKTLLKIEDDYSLKNIYDGLREELVEEQKNLNGFHGINKHVFTTCESPEEQAAEALGGFHNDWMVLLSLESEVMQFGDAGTFTFVINKQDLEIGDFSRVVGTLEG